MKLWLISQNINNGYDTFDSAVVAAETEEEARSIHPKDDWGLKHSSIEWDTSIWAPKDKVIVEYLGTTDREISGIILSSFNAG
jgi:hypothetical protein